MPICPDCKGIVKLQKITECHQGIIDAEHVRLSEESIYYKFPVCRGEYDPEDLD